MIRVTKVLTETFCEFEIRQEGKKAQKTTGPIAPFYGFAAPFIHHPCESLPPHNKKTDESPFVPSSALPLNLTPVAVRDLLKKTSPWLRAVMGLAAYNNAFASPMRVIPRPIRTVADIDAAHYPEIRRALHILLGGLLTTNNNNDNRGGEEEERHQIIQADSDEEILDILRAHPTEMRQRLSICATTADAEWAKLFYCHEAVVDRGQAVFIRDLIVIDDDGVLDRVKCKVIIKRNKTL